MQGVELVDTQSHPPCRALGFWGSTWGLERLYSPSPLRLDRMSARDRRWLSQKQVQKYSRCECRFSLCVLQASGSGQVVETRERLGPGRQPHDHSLG